MSSRKPYIFANVLLSGIIVHPQTTVFTFFDHLHSCCRFFQKRKTCVCGCTVMPERKPFAKIHGVRELLHSQIYVYDFFDFMTSLISLKQYCFNKNIEIVCLFLILSWIFSHFGQVLSQPVDTQSAGRIFKRTQNHA